MINIQFGLALFLGKITRWLLAIIRKSSGGAAPGLIALKIYPRFIQQFQGSFHQQIVISGTNGKTTTARMISKILRDNRQIVIHNREGSNLLRGIASTLIQKFPLIQKPVIGIWEADEAAIVSICKQLNPDYLVITNLFRDQLDRYGEIDTILKTWIKLLKDLPKLNLLLNGNDPSLVYLGSRVSHHTIYYFGLGQSNRDRKPEHGADAIFCPKCNRELHYQAVYFSHLGNFFCTCDFKQPKLNFIANYIKLEPNSAEFKINDHRLYLPLTGVYNIYNALTAFSLSQLMQIPVNLATKSISQFQPAYGRQENFWINDKKIKFYLVKNPTGFNQVIDTLKLTINPLILLIAINDRIADGTDVSWLWDVKFENLKPLINKIIITGDRVLDLGVRLKYAGYDKKSYEIIPDKKEAVGTLLKQKSKNLYILPTYTALWELRKLVKKYA